MAESGEWTSQWRAYPGGWALYEQYGTGHRVIIKLRDGHGKTALFYKDEHLRAKVADGSIILREGCSLPDIGERIWRWEVSHGCYHRYRGRDGRGIVVVRSNSKTPVIPLEITDDRLTKMIYAGQLLLSRNWQWALGSVFCPTSTQEEKPMRFDWEIKHWKKDLSECVYENIHYGREITLKANKGAPFLPQMMTHKLLTEWVEERHYFTVVDGALSLNINDEFNYHSTEPDTMTMSYRSTRTGRGIRLKLLKLEPLSRVMSFEAIMTLKERGVIKIMEGDE